jgi:hypothetical protein
MTGGASTPPGGPSGPNSSARTSSAPTAAAPLPTLAGGAPTATTTPDAGRKMAVNGELVKLADAMFAALDAYRARMTQGVARG